MSSFEYGMRSKTFAAYMTGLILCLLLTLSAFLLTAYYPAITKTTSCLYIVLSILAIVQLIVQSACFLRLNTDPEGRWNLMAFFFAILIVAILVGGSLWIMYNLNYNMSH